MMLDADLCQCGDSLGVNKPGLRVPALKACQRSPSRGLTIASAICERQEFPVAEEQNFFHTDLHLLFGNCIEYQASRMLSFG